MTTLYRSPNVVIEAHEWHVIVKKKDSRVYRRFYFRPLTTRAVSWQPVALWVGPKPKQLGKHLARFRRHADEAMVSEKVRVEAVAALRKVPSGAMLRNSGMAIEQAQLNC